MTAMTSNKPYLIRALYEWITDNHLTPYIVVTTDDPAIQVPMQYAEDGKIILNISPTAVRNLIISNEMVQFNARFGGVLKQVYAPIHSVQAIYARENGNGMVFAEEEAPLPPSGDDGSGGGAKPTTDKPKRGKPKLTIVK